MSFNFKDLYFEASWVPTEKTEKPPVSLRDEKTILCITVGNPTAYDLHNVFFACMRRDYKNEERMVHAQHQPDEIRKHIKACEAEMMPPEEEKKQDKKHSIFIGYIKQLNAGETVSVDRLTPLQDVDTEHPEVLDPAYQLKIPNPRDRITRQIHPYWRNAEKDCPLSQKDISTRHNMPGWWLLPITILAKIGTDRDYSLYDVTEENMSDLGAFVLTPEKDVSQTLYKQNLYVLRPREQVQKKSAPKDPSLQ